MQDNLEIIVTSDGSNSLLNTSLNETYHSRHGAVQESLHVFIDKGLSYYLKQNEVAEIRILEIGFGTGLNALLTLEFAQLSEKKIHYTTLEAYPLEEKIWMQLNYGESSVTRHHDFKMLHEAKWEEDQAIGSNFILNKRNATLQDINLTSECYQIVYYDAFAPAKQPDMWSIDMLTKIAASLRQGGVFVTYCARGQLKRDLQSLGFKVETLPGPPRKKEMVRAIKL